MLQKYKVYINNSSNIIIDDLKDFKKDYKCIEAAGGLVYNNKNQILMIFRNGYWDLPKGKRESYENITECAVREVCEESGVDNIKIGKIITTTYHTYLLNNTNYLKITKWFFMNTTCEKDLVPQISEGISKACWIDINDLHIKSQNTYGSIKDVLGYV